MEIERGAPLAGTPRRKAWPPATNRSRKEAIALEHVSSATH